MAINNTELKKFAQGARRQLLEQVAARMEQVLRSDSVEIREKEKVVQELREQIEIHGKKAVVDKVAYTWFNRFCALRFMDVNRYTRIGVVTPVEGGTQPEVLFEAKQGHIDEDLGEYVNSQVVFDLLSGKRPSSDAQGEAYRLLLVGICNYYGELMPFMFERIEDYTELLMPLDLLSENSVLHTLRGALGADECEDVEVIGWLYQYYISERKDEVFEALKKNQKIEAEDIPAATQLFTPHWIVRYLVENSLGRLWMLNHLNSHLTERMEYYIQPAQEETDFLRISSPEELRLLDPACGSGHILTYAFDLLAAIYEEEGYASSDIPKLILEKNIFGMEIDPRAGALSAFALTMKARAKDRRFFSRGVLPNICVLENVTFTDAELKQYMNEVGRDLFTEPLKETLRQFEQADNFGSLLRPILTDASYVRGLLESKNLGGDMFYTDTHKKVLKVLKFAEFLAPRYHVVTANPPYMGDRNMNLELKDFARDYYPDSKADLFAMSIERNLELVLQDGLVSMITMQSWMFLASFEVIRKNILEKQTILSMAHIGTRGFDSIGGAVVSTTAFILRHCPIPNWKGSYLRLTSGNDEAEKNSMLLEIFADTQKMNLPNYYAISTDEFKKIPGSPIAYWVNPTIFSLFNRERTIDEIAPPRIGMMTTDNNRFLRYWYEISTKKIGFHYKSIEDAMSSETKWFPYNKGGNYRKWAGNYELIVNWYKGGQEIKDSGMTSFRGKDFYFKSGITWGDISTETFSCRYTSAGRIFDIKGTSCFPTEKDLPIILSILNSKVGGYILNFLNPTITFQSGDIRRVPVPYKKLDDESVKEPVKRLIDISTDDWDSFEISWDFTRTKLFPLNIPSTIKNSYTELQKRWQELTLEMQGLEIDINRALIQAYDLQDELNPDIPLEQITLFCNPYYRYGNNKSEEELEESLCADTMREFISYAVGCMFGRYSLDKPGLILANQGETLKDYLKQVPKPTFMPDEDNAIPVLEGEWFNDDIAERFKKFLRLTFGEEHYEENLAFIEEAIGRDVRSYFVKEFYKDHVQMYKKRPIYWMFSSPKGSFNALIYMHRYQPDTVSIVLNNYLREYIKKLNAHKTQLERISVSGSASQSQKTKALKEIAQINKVLAELKDYEDDVLYPLATQQIAIDLDDGVKVNYGKFGSALAKIPGL